MDTTALTASRRLAHLCGARQMPFLAHAAVVQHRSPRSRASVLPRDLLRRFSSMAVNNESANKDSSSPRSTPSSGFISGGERQFREGSDDVSAIVFFSGGLDHNCTWHV